VDALLVAAVAQRDLIVVAPHPVAAGLVVPLRALFDKDRNVAKACEKERAGALEIESRSVLAGRQIGDGGAATKPRPLHFIKERVVEFNPRLREPDVFLRTPGRGLALVDRALPDVLRVAEVRPEQAPYTLAVLHVLRPPGRVGNSGIRGVETDAITG